MDKFLEGDIVMVFSLQSFFHGGFVRSIGIVRQDQGDNDNSVIVCTARNILGEIRMDYSYEVYQEQLQYAVIPTYNKLLKKSAKLLKKLKKQCLDYNTSQKAKIKLEKKWLKFLSKIEGERVIL